MSLTNLICITDYEVECVAYVGAGNGGMRAVTPHGILVRSGQ